MINPIFTIYPEIILDNRFLDLGNDTINNTLNNSNITNLLNGTNEGLYEDNPYIYFIGGYELFLFLGIYFILLIKKN